MLFSTAASVLAIAALASAAPHNAKRQALDNEFGLALDNDGTFDFSEVQTLKLSYANESAYFGMIKYEQYSEPLVLSGAQVGSDTAGGLSFLSIHSAPTGAQFGYIQPDTSAPLSFSVPHTGGNMPAGAASTGFYFSGGRPLLWQGKNNFYACQNPELKAMNTWQVWWMGAEQPLGIDCKGPIGINMIDPLDARTN